jgi:hypothetical protein
MFEVILSLILGVLLIILCPIFIYKNLLSEFRMSRSGFLTILILFIAIITLLCSFLVIIGTMGVLETIRYLNSSPNIPKDELDMLINSVPSGIKQIIEILIIGYSAFVVDSVIVKRIQKNKQIKADKNVSNRWHLK